MPFGKKMCVLPQLRETSLTTVSFTSSFLSILFINLIFHRYKTQKINSVFFTLKLWKNTLEFFGWNINKGRPAHLPLLETSTINSCPKPNWFILITSWANSVTSYFRSPEKLLRATRFHIQVYYELYNIYCFQFTLWTSR